MGVRQEFEGELVQLKTLIIAMAAKAEKSLLTAMQALKEQNPGLAAKAIDNDHEINQLDEEISETAIWLIAKQQPVATDLRKIISTIRIANDLERIGDQAANIAVAAIKIGNRPLYKPLEDIPKMSEKVHHMMTGILEAYKTDDTVLAKKVADDDNEIDEMYEALVQEMLIKIAESPELTEQIAQLAFVCRYLERIADHVTNISEQILFTVKGKRVDLNR